MPRAPKQLHFFNEKAFQHLSRDDHGGDTRTGLRKEARPLDPKRPLHLVLRSEVARGDRSMQAHSKRVHFIENTLYSQAKKYRIKIHRFSNNGNHLHILLSFKTKPEFQNFLRVFAGKIAQRILNAQRGAKSQIKFWSKLAYTRVVALGRRAFFNAYNYVMFNEAEAFFERKMRPPDPKRRP
jgi:REP element-mobilizing transposase RayT